jgi:trehalose 6-phosphate phosphatase
MRELRHLFSDDGRSALAAVLHARPLLAFDFDGTLAPIVGRPDEAQVTDAMALQLDRLAHLRPLAIFSGRSINDVRGRLGFEAQFIVGNHGAEDPALARPGNGALLDVVRERVDAAALELQRAGVFVEDKWLSLAFHYRGATDQRRAIERIAPLLASLPDTLRSFPGKCVFNVVVTAAPNKCQAVESLVRRAGCDSALFIGDDVNDEAVFVGAHANWLTIRVGREDPLSHATWFLDRHSEVATLLDDMLVVLEAG